jgi:hypothetical protein
MVVGSGEPEPGVLGMGRASARVLRALVRIAYAVLATGLLTAVVRAVRVDLALRAAPTVDTAPGLAAVHIRFAAVVVPSWRDGAAE